MGKDFSEYKINMKLKFRVILKLFIYLFLYVPNDSLTVYTAEINRKDII